VLRSNEGARAGLASASRRAIDGSGGSGGFGDVV